MQTHNTRKTCIGISKHPPRHTGKKSERDKNTYKYVDSDTQTEKDMRRFRHTNRERHAFGICKHPPRHTGRTSERDRNTYKYVDSDAQTEKDLHWNKQTPSQTHKQKE